MNISGICGILRLSDDNVIEVWKNLIAKTKLSYLLALSAMYIISQEARESREKRKWERGKRKRDRVAEKVIKRSFLDSTFCL